MLGLKRGTVELFEHQKEWEDNAVQTIAKLKDIFGKVAIDIQHVGSTSIANIKAKPIVDIAVGISCFETLSDALPKLEATGIYKSAMHAVPNDVLYVIGDFDDDTRTHHIHIVEYGSMQWKNYINFRDYLNGNPNVAKQYEDLKIELVTRNENNRNAYTDGKEDFINNTLRKALTWSYLGENVIVKIDRPIWSEHPKHPGLVYPINYGYIEGVFAPDGEELDVYILGVDKPLEVFSGRIIAIVHREDDVEDKLVAAPEGIVFKQAEIEKAIYFQEKYYKSKVEVL